MVKPPAVYLAGMLRMLGDRISTEDWVWLSIHGRPAALLPAERVAAGTTTAGSTPRPSRRAGTSRSASLQKHAFNPDHTKRGERARPIPRSSSTGPSRSGASQISDATRRSLLTYAQKTMAAAVADDDRQRKFPPMTLNALRHLVAASPEMQTA